MSVDKKQPASAGLAKWVVIAAGAGIVTGIAVGDYASVFRPLGQIYVMLLQSVVYPYIISSLLHGLGRLLPETAKRMFSSAWYYYAFLWAGVLGIAYVLAIAFPPPPLPAVLDGTVSRPDALGFLQLIVPANFFLDISENYVPAVVVFAVLYGIAIQQFKEKQSFLNVLVMVRSASVRIWGWIVHLAPVGVFALVADTAGTIRPDELMRVGTYLWLFMAGTLLLAFYTLPAIISAMTGTGHMKIIRDLKGAYTLSVVTTLSVVALPFIMTWVRGLVEEHGIKDAEREEIIETNLAISYPLAQVGNFFVYLFILFAAYLFSVTLSALEAWSLPLMILFSCVGSPSSSVNAVEFLSSWLSLGNSAPGLYVETMVVTRYGQVLASVTGFAFITALVTLSYFRVIGWEPAKLIRPVLVTGLALLLIVLGGRWFSQGIPVHHQPAYMEAVLPGKLANGLDVKVLRTPEGFGSGRVDRQPGEETLACIKRTKTLYVGYNEKIVPFSYCNNRGELVGYDVAMAYRLARALNVRLVFVPFTWSGLDEDLQEGRFDIAMSGIFMTESRMRMLSVSQSYYHDQAALLVPSLEAPAFVSFKEISAMPELRVACFEDPVLIGMAHDLFADAEVVIVNDYGEIARDPDAGAGLWTFTQASQYALGHPGLTAVKPRNLGGVIPFAYIAPLNSPMFMAFVNNWMSMERSQGTFDSQAVYWLHGGFTSEPKPRWSLLQMLHGAR